MGYLWWRYISSSINLYVLFIFIYLLRYVYCFSCWNYLTQKIQEKGISWKQHCIEFMVNSWDSVHTSENKLTTYFIGKVSNFNIFILDTAICCFTFFRQQAIFELYIHTSVVYSLLCIFCPDFCNVSSSMSSTFFRKWCLVKHSTMCGEIWFPSHCDFQKSTSSFVYF